MPSEPDPHRIESKAAAARQIERNWRSLNLSQGEALCLKNIENLRALVWAEFAKFHGDGTWIEGVWPEVRFTDRAKGGGGLVGYTEQTVDRCVNGFPGTQVFIGLDPVASS